MSKRDPSLIPLSHDHHQALFQAMKLKRVTGDDRDEVVANFLNFWNEHGRKHFAIEEELLLPAYARHASNHDPTIVQVLTEHVDIRRRVGDVADGSGATNDDLRELGERFDGHVRLEERVLFPQIEATLPADELSRLGAAIEAAESGG